MFYGMVSLPGQQSASPSPSTPFPNSQKSPVCSFSKTSLYFLLIPPRFFAACLKHAAIFKDFFCTLKQAQSSWIFQVSPFPWIESWMELPWGATLWICPLGSPRTSLPHEVCMDLCSPCAAPARIPFHSFPPFPAPQTCSDPMDFNTSCWLKVGFFWFFWQEFSEKKPWKTPNRG